MPVSHPHGVGGPVPAAGGLGLPGESDRHGPARLGGEGRPDGVEVEAAHPIPVEARGADELDAVSVLPNLEGLDPGAHDERWQGGRESTHHTIP